MKVEPKAFLAIEQSMANALRAEWDKLADPLIMRLHSRLAAGQWAIAQEVVNGWDFAGIVRTIRPKLEELALSALIFGAHRASGSVKDTVFARGDLPPELHTALDQLEHAIEHDAADYVRDAVHAVIEDAKRADERAHMQKGLYEAELTERTRQFNEATDYDDNTPDLSNKQVDRQDKFLGRDLAHPQKYDPDEPRASDGEWTTGGAGGAGHAGAPAGAAAQGLQDQGSLHGGAGGLAAPSGADLTTPLQHLPVKVKVQGKALDIGPYAPARQAAFDYAKEAGIDYHPPTEYVKVDPARATRIAKAYDEMQNDPDDPAVKAAYGALIKECMGQWKAVEKTGLKIDFIPDGAPDPYAVSPRLMTEDVRKNNHMWVFPTLSGFGTDSHFDASKNPLLGDAGVTINGHHLVYNDVFRIVHDFFGHVKEGNGFRADGEENAWRSHMAMFSPLARRALTSETRGQNSWVNYGPYGETNRTADSAHTHFADQKVGIMPEWTAVEGSGLPGDPALKKWDEDEPRDDEGRWTATTTHPQTDDQGHTVTIKDPHEPSPPEAVRDLEVPMVFTPECRTVQTLNGVKLAPWADHPTTSDGWLHVKGQDKKLSKPFEPTPHKHIGAGLIVAEPDGRIWLTCPTNQYGGYRVTWPKGTVEHGLNLQGSAIKEAFEETGLKVAITGVLGDYERDTSKARFFVAKRVGGTPAAMGWESQAAILATPAQAAKLLHRSHDLKILKDYVSTLKKDDLSGAQLAASGGLLEPEQAEAPKKRKRQRITKTVGKKTLYVHRPLLQTDDLYAWLKAQGFKQAQKPSDLHVTQCYSKTPFDWDHLEPKQNTVVVTGGPRSIQQFGPDGGVIVLELDSPELQGDHDEFKQAGASYDFPSYRPHVSLTWEGAPRPVAQIEPYTGPLVFGPQVFKPINDDWKADRKEIALKADWDIVGALNKAVKTGGKVASDLGAQMTTSRLITFGFLSQSQKLGHDVYQVDEVLDEKTCPVCLYMNGRTFRVATQLQRVFQALQAQDPADLKTLSPWPDQGDMEGLYAMSEDEMQASGYGAPPYHPNCRGMLALAGTVEAGVPLGGPDLGEATPLDSLFDGLPVSDAEDFDAAAGEAAPFVEDQGHEHADDEGEEGLDEVANVGKWTPDAIQALGWKRFDVTDPATFARVDAYFQAGKYDAAEALIDGWVATQKEDEFDGPNAPKKKRVNQTPAGKPMDYSDIQSDSSSIAFDPGVPNLNLAPLDRA